MNKELYQYPENLIYTKKRNRDSAISIRSAQSNKSSASTKAKSNLSIALNDSSTITSFVFNLTNTLLITNINQSITSSLLASSHIASLHGSKADNRANSSQHIYLNSCIDSIDRNIQGALCLSSINKVLQEELVSLSDSAKDSMKGVANVSEGRSSSNYNGSELRILRINKQALNSKRNNSNEEKEYRSTTKDKEGLIRLVKGNERFNSPPVGNSTNKFGDCNNNRMIKEHCSQITNITPVSIKIKVYNSTNINEKLPFNQNSNLIIDNKSGNLTLKNKNGKRVLTLPKKGTEYVKASSPKPTIPTEMHKEMNATHLIKPNPKNQSLGYPKPGYRAGCPDLQNKQLLNKQSHHTSLNQSHINNNAPKEIQSPIQPKRSQIGRQNKTNSKSTAMKPPLYPKPTTVKSVLQPIIANSQAESEEKDKLNLSCDNIYPKPNLKRAKCKLSNSEFNKSFDTIKEEYTVFDLDNDIFSVINNGCIKFQEKPSAISNSQLNSKNEQEKCSLDVIRESNEGNFKGEDWERSSANFHKEQFPDCFDRFSFHNKKADQYN